MQKISMWTTGELGRRDPDDGDLDDKDLLPICGPKGGPPRYPDMGSGGANARPVTMDNLTRPIPSHDIQRDQEILPNPPSYIYGGPSCFYPCAPSIQIIFTYHLGPSHVTRVSILFQFVSPPSFRRSKSLILSPVMTLPTIISYTVMNIFFQISVHCVFFCVQP
jgi:hypothetical protein